jgi:Flp pilus assembly protein TadB
MAQTRKRRRTKHRGNAAGVIEARGRTGRKLTTEERKPTGKEARQQRWEQPPTWRSAATRAAFAAVIFGVLVVALMGRSVSQAVVIAAFMLVLYIPLGYYMDMAIYRRRKRRAAQGGRSR